MRIIFTYFFSSSYRKALAIGFCCLMSLLLYAPGLMAQTEAISGNITSAEDGSALPGVNVIVKGTTIGTVTDIDGNYRLNVPADAQILTFSFIGFAEQEVEIGDRSVINVQMVSDVKQLSEVIVTAVGIEREKRALGYAVTSLDADQVAQKSEPDPVRALQGKVPGVNIIGGGGAVGSGTNITIRGNSSLLGNNQPLFVVDGVPFDNSTYQTGSFAQGATTSSNRSFDLDPNNIESMTVLKGAAASALYGSRAANGVIVITTKSGRVGSKKGMEVSYNGSYSFEEVANLPDYQTRYTQGNNFKYVDGNFGTWGAPFDVTTPAWQNPLNADLLLGTDENGFPLVAHPYDRYPDRFPDLVDATVPLRAYNTPEDFFRTGHVFENAVSVTAGGEKANFTAGFSRTDNEGITPYNEVSRTGINAGGNAQLENGIFINGSINYVRTDLTSPPIAGLWLTGGTSITERLLYTPPNVNVAGYPIEDAEGNGAFYRPDNDNPYWLAKYAPHTSEVDRYYGKISVGYDVFEWLNVTYQAGFNAYTDHRINVLPISTNAFPTGRIVQDDIAYRELDGNLIFTADKELNEDFNLKVIAGHNANSRTFDRQSFQGTGIIVRGIHDLDNTQSVIPNGGGLEEIRYQGVYGDIGLSYRDYAFLNVSGRNDWHSGLPVGKRSFFYPSVSGSLIFTDAFNIQSNILTLGKLRAGWATSGNDTDAYLTQTVFLTNSRLGNNIAALDFPFRSTNVQTLGNTIGNNDLKPEVTKEFEVGTELQLFNGKVGIDFTYYNRNSFDQIVPIEISPSTGFTTAVANIGKVNNEGIELGLDLTPVQVGDFRWNIYTAFTRNRNIVEEIAEGLDQVFVGGFGNSVRIEHKEGEPFGQIFGQVAAKAPDGQLLVDPSTGKLILQTEFETIGDPNPDFILGVTNSFSWKGITLSALLDWRKGGDMVSGTFNQLFGRGLTTETIPDGPRGREITLVIPGVLGDPATQEPVLDENGNTIPNGTQLTVNDWFFINTFGSAGADEFSVFDASTVRLREVTLSYELPTTWLEKTPFGTASISLTGRNLWFNAYNFPKSLNFDPETSSLGSGNLRNLGGSSDGSGNAQGIDFGIIPTTRRYGVNLRLTF